MQAEAFFLPIGDGQRFCLFHAAQTSDIRGLVLYVHPFAEEMNKARRMAALQARALAQAGYAVLQIDLLGCGDSSGDFGDATWEQWVNDVVLGCRWLRSKDNAQGVAADQIPLWLWGLRAGCLLAVDAARQMDEVCNFLFWQPPAAGKTLLQQFLRLKVAGDMMGGQSKGIMETMRQRLASGSPVEIAGYMLSSGLASGLEQASLVPPMASTRSSQRLEWLELSTREDASLSPASAKTIAQWQQAGLSVGSHVALGPAFWQTTEIEDAPGLIAATTAALSNLSR
ncbi:MAG: hydrolase 2, exosortase A system-associated [Aquabacterium sp.]|nr:hydrolase 2, exosortase A system-associated [Aquabacterium sp.]